jgi:hypothetical protein
MGVGASVGAKDGLAEEVEFSITEDDFAQQWVWRLHETGRESTAPARTVASPAPMSTFAGIRESPATSEQAAETAVWTRIGRDYRNFYRPDALLKLGGGLAAGGLMANTHIDREIHRKFQSGVRSASSDEWFEILHSNKELGNQMYTVPILAAVYASQQLLPASPQLDVAGQWAERSLRGYLVGFPHVLALQLLTGGSRPGEQSYESRWQPLADDNGVSGHGFISATPFIAAAKMTDNRVLKGACYAGSLLGPLSRVNDDAHFASQACLGWWLAYLSVSAVDATDGKSRRLQMHPYIDAQGSGLAAEFAW